MESVSRRAANVLLVYIFGLVISQSSGYFSNSVPEVNTSCFCELKGSINDCGCNVDTVDHYNNMKIYPRLQSILRKNFFRFYKVNLKQECPFARLPDDSKCAMRFCHIQTCAETDIPEGLKGHREAPSFKYTSKAHPRESGCSENDFSHELGYLNTSISPQAHEEFQRWADHDAAEDDFCILDDQYNGAEYVDLLLNPERYTGYRGESAHRIWKSIYLENCFRISNRTTTLTTYIPHLDIVNACMEQRAFYRLISGVHASINIHLCSKYLLSDSQDFFSSQGTWGINMEEFRRRFSAETTNKEGPHWLKNLYFTYLLELRALAKAAPYLRMEEYYTGSAHEDFDVKMAIKDLMNTIEGFPNHFNEHLMFSSGMESIKLKSEFREKFRNISRIMDCVGCDKCRLWGKLQTQGLGTALKILYSDKFNMAAEKGIWHNHTSLRAAFRLSRTEIVSLFNAFGRLSNSIFELENFRKVLR